VTDRVLIGMLKQFDDRVVRTMKGIMAECGLTSESQVLKSMDIASQSSQMDMQELPEGIEAESRLLLEVSPEGELWRASDSLRALFINECESLINPIIAVDSLEKLEITNCSDLVHPFIACAGL
jgi:hypothetical protein